MRIKPAVGDAMLRKVSKDSLYVDERKFTFDAVFDSDATQVYNCLLLSFHLHSLIQELILLSLLLRSLNMKL